MENKPNPKEAKHASDQMVERFIQLSEQTSLQPPFTITLDFDPSSRLSFSGTGEVSSKFLINTLAAAILHFAKADVYKTYDDGEQMKKIEDMYDYLNYTFSGTLRLFAPHIDIHEPLTEEIARRVLQEEDELLKAKCPRGPEVN